MIWIRVFFLIITCITINFFIGNYTCYLLGFKKNIAKIFCVGFVLLLAVFQIIAYPFAQFNGSFKIMVIIYVLIIVILFCFSLYYFIRNIEFKITIKFKKRVIILGGILVALILCQTILSTYLYHDDDDDGYFITVSSTTIESDSVSSNVQYATTGIKSTQVEKRSNTATWEYLTAVLSYMFNIEPVIVAHTVLPILLIPLSYLAVYLISMFFVSDNYRLYFMIIYALTNMYGGYSVYSTAAFLLLRIWQGKAVLVSIIFPILLANCIELMKVNKHKPQYWIFNSLILLAGVCSSVIGVYLTLIYYITIGIPYMFMIGWKESKKIIFKIIISIIPCAIFTIISLIQVIKNNYLYMQAIPPNWYNVFKDNMLSKYYIILFIVAFIYTLIKGDYIQKIVICGTTIFSFLTFLNPFLCNIVSQKITGVDVYWRLYWTLPIYYSIAFFLSHIICNMKKIKYIVVGIIVITITLNYMGRYIYQEPYYSKHTNMYKLPNEVIDIVNYILKNKDEDKPDVLFPENLAAKARQYSIEVTTVWSRNLYQGNNIVPNMNITLNSFYYSLYSGQLTNIEYILDVLYNLNVEWLVVPKTLGFLEGEQLPLLVTIDGYNVYKVTEDTNVNK